MACAPNLSHCVRGVYAEAYGWLADSSRDTGHWLADNCNPAGVDRIRLASGQTPLDTNLADLPSPHPDCQDWPSANWPGWDGPYLETVKDTHPWGGTYSISYHQNLGRGSAEELVLELENMCTDDNSDESCGGSKEAFQKIDEQIDDGVEDEGAFQYAVDNTPGVNTYDAHWVFVWDYD